MSTLQVIYDGMQHCMANREPHGNQVAMDCPLTGKGEEFSPGNLVGAGLAGCMLLSMGTLAMRDNIDIEGTKVDVELIETGKSSLRLDTIQLNFNMARNYSEKERLKLERAAAMCPIKASFHSEVTILVNYKYPE